jgi:hypothetical protein
MPSLPDSLKRVSSMLPDEGGKTQDHLVTTALRGEQENGSKSLLKEMRNSLLIRGSEKTNLWS